MEFGLKPSVVKFLVMMVVPNRIIGVKRNVVQKNHAESNSPKTPHVRFAYWPCETKREIYVFNSSEKLVAAANGQNR